MLLHPGIQRVMFEILAFPRDFDCCIHANSDNPTGKFSRKGGVVGCSEPSAGDGNSNHPIASQLPFSPIGSVRAEDNDPESSFRLMLSRRTIGGASLSLAVMRFLHSSSSLASVITGTGPPVAMMPIHWARSPFPVPCIGASIRWRGAVNDRTH